MSSKTIPGRHGTTVIHESNAPYGEIGGMPAPPDKTTEQRERERRKDRIKYSEVLKQFGWTDVDFATAKRFGFPPALGRGITGIWSTEVFYSRSAIAAFSADLKAFAAAKLPK